MKRILCIYNTCGISGKDNTDYYIPAIESILQQKFSGVQVLLSSCLNTSEQRKKLSNHFGRYITYNYIDEILPVCVTFNFSIWRAIQEFGQFEYYLYVDSGTTFENQIDAINNLYKLAKSGPYGIITARVNNDMGYGTVNHEKEFKTDYIVPLGDAFNAHVDLFSNKLFQAYNRVQPDIFSAYCTESIQTFVCAAIKLKWIVSKEVVLRHERSLDGPSSGFRHGHDLLFRSNKSIFDILNTPEAWECGIGYESFRGIRNYNPDMFDKNGYAITSKLYLFIKDNFFLKPEQLDYTQIKHEFIS